MKVAHRAIVASIGLSLTASVGAANVAGADGAVVAGSEPPAIQWSVVPNQPIVGPWLPAAPLVAIWSSGQIITADPVFVHPAPLVMPQVVGTVDQQVVEDLIERARRDGLLGDEFLEQPPISQAPHAPMTTLVLNDGVEEWSHTVYGLRSDGSETGRRATLAEFIELISGPLDPSMVPYVPDVVTVRAQHALGDAPGSVQVAAWPKTGPELTDTGECVDVSDPDTVDVLLQASELTRFEADGVIWQVAARPEIPGAPYGC